MFFLLRMAFWLGLVLVLLPREKTPESEKLPQIGASEAVSAATAAVSDMGQFCKRQRAQDGARQLYKIITDKKPPDHTSSVGGGDAEAAVADVSARETLTEADMAVEYRGLPTH
jgi:uncharacterized protein DUF5330